MLTPILILLMAYFPVHILVQLYRAERRRRAAGRCRHCGYDLTGNTSGVCPECGKEVVSGKC